MFRYLLITFFSAYFFSSTFDWHDGHVILSIVIENSFTEEFISSQVELSFRIKIDPRKCLHQLLISRTTISFGSVIKSIGIHSLYKGFHDFFFFTIRRNSIVICSCNSSAFIILLHLNKGFIYTLTAQRKLNSISELHFICPDPSPTIRLERYLSSLPWNLNFRGSCVWVKRRPKSKLHLKHVMESKSKSMMSLLLLQMKQVLQELSCQIKYINKLRIDLKLEIPLVF